jgi:hypothetical protein
LDSTRHQWLYRPGQSHQTAEDSRAAPLSQDSHLDLLPGLKRAPPVALRSQRDLVMELAVQADVHDDFSTQHSPDHC